MSRFLPIIAGIRYPGIVVLQILHIFDDVMDLIHGDANEP